MTQISLQLPNFSFTELLEKKVDSYFWDNFSSDDWKSFNSDFQKPYIKKFLKEFDNKQDRIIVQAHLINRLTEKLLKNPESIYREDYEDILFMLYRSLEKDGVAIPNDLFSNEDFQKAESLLLKIDIAFEQLKYDNPDKIEPISAIQDDVKKSKKFLWLGKEKWCEVLMGTIVKLSLEKQIFPLLTNLFTIISGGYSKFIG